MDGKPLYEYARAGEPLPRPVDPRSCTVHSLTLVDWQDTHNWNVPKEAMEPEMVSKLESLVDAPRPDAAATEMAEEEGPGPAFTVEMTVSSGVCVSEPHHARFRNAADFGLFAHSRDLCSVSPKSTRVCFVLMVDGWLAGWLADRSIIHDIGLALNSVAHVVVLERSRQGDYALEPASSRTTADANDLPKTLKPCADWSVFAKALEQARSGSAEAKEPGESEWEKAILDILETGSPSEKQQEEQT